MNFKAFKRCPAALFLILALPSGGPLLAQPAPNAFQREIKKYRISPAREAGQKLSPGQIEALARKKIKYVFVIYQENRSFDSYFGTFPGADGLFSRSPAQTPGFYQEILTTAGGKEEIHPFRIGPAQFAADTDDVDHSHPGIVDKMDVPFPSIQGRPIPINSRTGQSSKAGRPIPAKLDESSGPAKMDRFALAEELKHSPKGAPSLEAKQFGELTMAYEDCDTVPILWAYASKFALFDHIFQLMAGPSTPGNLSIIGAQTGMTQWVLHPEEAYPDNGKSAPGVPVLNDNDPFWGSSLDPTPPARKMPVNPEDIGRYGTALNLTFATLPLTLMGGRLGQAVRSDEDPKKDLADVGEDVRFISRQKRPGAAFGWYEEGYGQKPAVKDDDDNDDPVDAAGVHASYITHHNGPQYFGYISNNPKMRRQLHDLGDFFRAVRKGTLPAAGGVFYVKGGSRNEMGLKPADPDPEVRKRFRGDDDHPAYSDAQISEALAAKAVNAVAASRYWRESAVIITWDDSEGDYDHVPPPLRARGPDNSILGDGPRVPLILISPYARAGFISHAQGNHASVVKFVDAIFGLTPLARLPVEYGARAKGEKEFGQPGLGPEDALTKGVSNLLGALSPSRLDGRAPPLPKDYAMIPDSLIDRLPPQTHFGCRSLGIATTDRARGIANDIPADFNPRPATDPTRR